MDVRRESKHEVIEALRRRYRGAGRVEKGRVSDEAAAVTGYHRRYGQALLRKGVPNGGPRLRRGGRPRVYGWEVEQALVVAAEATGWICGKRLVAALPDLVPALEREGGRRWSGCGRVCPSPCAVWTVTTAASSSMPIWCATARPSGSRSRAAAPTTRTTRPTSSRRTGQWCANWSATTAMRAPRRWPRWRRSMPCCTCT